ncbi:MAG: LytTR family DNA-binding domain-containing protein [Bacteroidota bacterium]
MKLRCLIIDDEKPARDGLVAYTERIDFLELVGECKSAIEANQMLQEQVIDLLFLDIQMPDWSGIEWLQSINQPPLTIFTTAYREYAVDGFELNAVDYLVKPIAFSRFLKASNKALQVFNAQQATPVSSEADHIFIKVDHQLVKLYFKDILYLEAAGDYIFIHTIHGRYMTLLSLKKVEADLPTNTFIRIHRSYLVNKEMVTAIEGNQVVIAEQKLPISRSAQEMVLRTIIGGKLWRRDG